MNDWWTPRTVPSVEALEARVRPTGWDDTRMPSLRGLDGRSFSAVTGVRRSTGPLVSRYSAQSRSRANISRAVAAALYRDLCGLRLREISDHVGVAASTAHAALERHRWLVAEVDGCADARVASLVVRRAFPPPVRALCLPPRTAMGVGADAESA